MFAHKGLDLHFSSKLLPMN